MNILILDTSTNYCSITIKNNQHCISLIRQSKKEHNLVLIDLIDEILIKSKIKKNKINMISYGIGPGSFVGIRIASSFATGFKIGNNIKITGFSSTKAISYYYYYHYKKPIQIIIKANYNNVYYGFYDFKLMIFLEKIMSLNDVIHIVNKKFFIISDIDKIKSHINIIKPNLYYFAQYLYQNLHNNNIIITNPKPTYLQNIFKK